MSIVNQVLNELEKRGKTAPLGEDTTLRPVAPRGQSRWPLFLLLTLLLLLLLAAIRWSLGRTEASMPEKNAVAAAPVNRVVAASGAMPEAVSAPAGALSENAASGVAPVLESLHGKPLLPIQSEEEPVAAPDVKKTAKGKPGHARAMVEEEDGSLSTESLEQLKTVSPQQRAENEFNQANLAVKEGRTNDALAGYENALLADPTYKPARRAWAGLLVSLKRNSDAEPVLQRGLKRDPQDTGFAMLLARLQVERGDIPLALETLQKTLPYAAEQADYQSFVAALLQRQGQHDEAVARYQIALKLAPNNGLWWMGLGISLQALQRKEEARDAYQHALATNSLSPQLQAYVQQKLTEL